ncbi:MAG: tetratricopeptide repeat protein [Isosphaeraceae bacterium]
MMIRKTSLAAAVVFLLALPAGQQLWAYHGFGGARGGGGGGGFRGGGGGGYRGGSGGMQSFGRTPSFSAGSYARPTGGYSPPATYGNRGSFEGMRGGQIDYGSRGGSYTTQRGGTINYGAAGVGAHGPGGGEAGRGVYGVSGTTAGGRSYGDVGRVGGAVGPQGGAVAGRSNLGVVSGPHGTAIEGNRAYGISAARPYGFNAYGGYHAGWMHGYWGGHNYAAWGWRNPYWGGWGWGMGTGLGLGLGLGLGWGLSSWGYGSALYGMGYMPYSNPYYNDYYSAPGAIAAPYNYSQPIDTTAAPADDSVSQPAVALFDAGRAAFYQGNYTEALQQTDAALASLPSDTTLHEFRALCLFALKRYDEAAAALYAVLSVGPGWDWTTMIGLYPGIDPYTAQLRALEDYCRSNPNSTSARFVLAYHYLTQGNTEAGVSVLKQIVALRPDDTLSAKLLRQLDAPASDAAPAASPATSAPAAVPAASAPAESTPPQGASINGTWTAQPADDTSIALSIQPGGEFNWQVTQKGQPRQFSGKATYDQGILTLVQDKGPALVGRVDWKDANHMAFHIVGDGPDDPGLNFSR